MDLSTILILVAAGIGGGIVSSVVGGGSLVTYPALLGVGVPPLLAAVATNTSLVPSNMIAALADRAQLPAFRRAFIGLIAASILAAAAGALALLATPERIFEKIVPALLGFSTILFAFSERVSAWMKARAAKRGRSVETEVASLKLLLPVSFYGGYFGSGVGIMLLGVLSLATGGNYRAANVLKNLMGSLSSLAAATIYIVQGSVLWPQTLALASGAVVGGLIGSWLARVMPREIARVVVVVSGTLLTAICIYKYWL